VATTKLKEAKVCTTQLREEKEKIAKSKAKLREENVDLALVDLEGYGVGFKKEMHQALYFAPTLDVSLFDTEKTS